MTVLEPAVQAHLDAADLKGLHDLDIAGQRTFLSAEIDRMFDLFGLPGPPVHAIRDHQIPVAGGSVLARTYHPPTAAPVPAHVLLHGGGWTTGSINERVADATARHRTISADCVSVLLEYRLAPEFAFPTAINDVVRTVRWLRDHAGQLGIDPAVITLGGSSAGANLAAAAVLAQPDLDVTALVLEVPALDLRSTDTTALPPQLASLAAAAATAFDRARHAYLGDLDRAHTPLASPVLGDLTRFPDTHLLTAQYDVLRPGAEHFADLLASAGRTVSMHCYPGALHGSPILTRTWPTAQRWHQDVLTVLGDVHRRAQKVMP